MSNVPPGEFSALETFARLVRFLLVLWAALSDFAVLSNVSDSVKLSLAVSVRGYVYSPRAALA